MTKHTSCLLQSPRLFRLWTTEIYDSIHEYTTYKNKTGLESQFSSKKTPSSKMITCIILTSPAMNSLGLMTHYLTISRDINVIISHFPEIYNSTATVIVETTVIIKIIPAIVQNNYRKSNVNGPNGTWKMNVLKSKCLQLKHKPKFFRDV